MRSLSILYGEENRRKGREREGRRNLKNIGSFLSLACSIHHSTVKVYKWTDFLVLRSDITSHLNERDVRYFIWQDCMMIFVFRHSTIDFSVVWGVITWRVSHSSVRLHSHRRSRRNIFTKRRVEIRTAVESPSRLTPLGTRVLWLCTHSRSFFIVCSRTSIPYIVLLQFFSRD